MAEYLDRRLRNVLIVIGRTRLAEVLLLPAFRYSRLHVRPRLDASEFAKRLEASIGARSTAKEYAGFGTRIFGHDGSDVRVDNAIHRPVERLTRFHPAIK